MGIDTKGFVLTTSKDVLKVTALAQNALNKLINDDRRKKFGDLPSARAEARKQYSNVDCRLVPESGMAQFTFKFRGENRMLSMFFTCDCDQEEYGPKSISMSMGCHGYSDVFVQAVLHAMSLLGPAYFDHNDCDEIDPAVLDVKKPTLLQAVALGYVPEYYLEEWVNYLYDAGAVQGKDSESFKLFFGDTQSKYLQLLALSEFKERVAAVEALASKQPAIPRPFMDELLEETA